MLPTWLFLLCLPAIGWGRKDGRMLTVYLMSSVFGASAVMTVFLLGNAPVTPAVFFVPLLIWASVRNTSVSTWLSGFSLREPGGWLAAYALWGGLSAYVMPRLFQEQLMVYSTSRGDISELGVQLMWLAPNSTNVTQTIYLLLGLVAFMSARAMLNEGRNLTWLKRGLYGVAMLNVFFGVLDLISSVARVELGLSFIRNANYAIVQQSIGGWPRIQGAFSEPSALAGFTIGLVGVLLTLWLRGYESSRTAPLVFGNVSLLLLTLSSTAFASLSLLLVLSFAAYAVRSTFQNQRLRFGFASAFLLVALSVACILALWMPPWLVKFLDIAHAMLFEKMSSDSGIGRMEWVQGNIDNFIATYGLGVGLGSARGSSFPMVVLGNLGGIGVLTMGLFLGLCLFTPARQPLNDEQATWISALRFGLVGILIAGSLAGSGADLGAFHFVIAGGLAGLLARRADHRNEARGDQPEDVPPREVGRSLARGRFSAEAAAGSGTSP